MTPLKTYSLGSLYIYFEQDTEGHIYRLTRNNQTNKSAYKYVAYEHGGKYYDAYSHRHISTLAQITMYNA